MHASEAEGLRSEDALCILLHRPSALILSHTIVVTGKKCVRLTPKRDKKWGNFREWAKNQHPVLSMWMAHELHPFTRAERLSVLLCYLCWAFFITVMFESVSLSVMAARGVDGGVRGPTVPLARAP